MNKGQGHCAHERQESSTSTGARYCMDCGLRMITEPPEIRLKPRAGSPWRRISSVGYCVELGRVYIGARFNEKTGVWMIGRVIFCEDCGHFEVAQQGRNIHQRDHSPARITHLAPDLLGCPSDGPEAAPLPSAKR